MEHMGKYPVIYCDFKVHVFSLRTVWKNRLCMTESYWQILGGMLSGFKGLDSILYREWEDCLMQSLKPEDKTYFGSICLKTANLSHFLAQKFNRGVILGASYSSINSTTIVL